MSVAEDDLSDVADGPLDQALDAALRYGPYHANAFRLADLPVDATPERLRRRRDEVEMAAELGTPLATAPAGPPRVPEATPQVVLAAVDGLRDPVNRLVQELFWLWRGASDVTPGFRAHDDAVVAHCTAAEATGPTRLPLVELADAWSRALADWHRVLSDDTVWDHLRERVRVLDDRRLTTGTVRRLRARVPSVILATAARAVTAAAEQDTDVGAALRDVVRRSPFADADVDRALRESVAHLDARVRRLCEEAETATEAEAARGTEFADRLLRDSGAPLGVVRTVLGDRNPLTRAVSDSVALAVRGACVLDYNERDDAAAVLPVLRRGVDLAVEESTREKCLSDVDFLDGVSRRQRGGAPSRAGAGSGSSNRSGTSAPPKPVDPTDAAVVARVFGVAGLVLLAVSVIVLGAAESVPWSSVAGVFALLAWTVGSGFAGTAAQRAPIRRALAFVLFGPVLLVAWTFGAMLGGRATWLTDVVALVAVLYVFGGVIALLVALADRPIAQGATAAGCGAALVATGMFVWGGVWLVPAGAALLAAAAGMCVRGRRSFGAVSVGTLSLVALSLVLLFATTGVGWRMLVAGIALGAAALVALVASGDENTYFGALGGASGLVAAVYLFALGVDTIGLGWTIAITVGVVLMVGWLAENG